MIPLAYLLAFLLGLVTGYALGLSARPATLGGMPTSTVRSTWLNFWPILLVVLMLVVAGLGVAKVVTDRAVNRLAAERVEAAQVQTDCISEWGAEVVRTIETRTEGTRKLERATARKDQAFDNIIRISAQLRRIPPKAVEADLQLAIFEANRARIRLEDVREELAVARAENPYPESPVLTCANEATED